MKSLMPQIDSNDGLFHNGNPATGEQGTRVTDTWLNNLQDRVRDVQAEAHYVLQKAEFRPVENKQTQLYEAIVKIIDDNRKSASTTQKGEVRLTSDTGLDSEELGLTAKAGKKLAQLIATVQLALNNYIPLNKRSSAVNSNDENNVATSKAVKTAYDKGVEAKTAADAAQLTANDGVTKANAAQNAADNAQQSAETANTNANTRVAKSGDTMTGSLTIARASKKYKVGSYSWDKFIDLSSDAVIGNDKCVIGFNNNGALHLGGKPNAAEFNASIDESMLWVRGDVQTKTGKSLNKSVSIDDFTTIKAETGWTKLPTGLIIQWGQFLPSNLINNETGSMTFPQRYPNSVFCVICGSVGGSSGNGTEGFAVISQDNSKFNWKSYWEGRHKRDFPEKIQWIAIGY